jgi:hypothetical protein
MGEGTTVRSPWSLSRDDPHPMRGYSPGSRSSPSRAADYVPPPSRRDSVKPMPVVGSGGAAELEKAMDRGIRGDSRR